MKVKIEVTVDIDPEAWALEYGVDPGKVREDVKYYGSQTLIDHFANLGLLAPRQ